MCVHVCGCAELIVCFRSYCANSWLWMPCLGTWKYLVRPRETQATVNAACGSWVTGEVQREGYYHQWVEYEVTQLLSKMSQVLMLVKLLLPGSTPS